MRYFRRKKISYFASGGFTSVECFVDSLRERRFKNSFKTPEPNAVTFAEWLLVSFKTRNRE